MNQKNLQLLRDILSRGQAQRAQQGQSASPTNVAATQEATPIAQVTAGNGGGAGATISTLSTGAGQTANSPAQPPMPNQGGAMDFQGMKAKAMLQQLLGNAGIDSNGMGKRAMLKAYAGQNQITDPNGGRFRNREMLQGILSKFNQPVGQPAVGGPAQPAPAPAPTQGIAAGEPAPGGTGQQVSTGQAMPGAQTATPMPPNPVKPANLVHNKSYQAPIRTTNFAV